MLQGMFFARKDVTEGLSEVVLHSIRHAVEVLKRGGVVAFPTDTVYGLGCDAFNIAAVRRVYEIKQRSYSLPMPVLLGDLAQLDMVARTVSNLARFLMDRFWPGGLTLVLSRTTSVPDIVTAGSNRVGVRLPNHVVPLTISRLLGVPIIGTSANLSDRPSPVTAEDVRQQLGDSVDFVVEFGRCPGGRESTVVDVNAEKITILRHGIIPDSEIERAYQDYLKEAGDADCTGL
jgi:L-threonylcarbamoyladenylate synthase